MGVPPPSVGVGVAVGVIIVAVAGTGVGVDAASGCEVQSNPESTEGRPWGQPLKEASGCSF